MTRLLAWFGLGGFYRYTFHGHLPQIVGPYRRRRTAEVPARLARLYGVRQEVRFHWRSPATAIADVLTFDEPPTRSAL